MVVWRTAIRHIATGAGYGSLTYLLALAFGWQTTVPTQKNILGIIVMSSLIGGLTMVFKFDRLSYLAALSIHFWGTLALVMFTITVEGGHITWELWASFVAIYLLIWLSVRVSVSLKVDKINQVLSRRRQK